MERGIRSRLHARVNAELCSGCDRVTGLCEEICPQVFALVCDRAEVVADPVPGSAESRCYVAARKCPTGAIALSKDYRVTLDKGEAPGSKSRTGCGRTTAGPAR